jgi:hypothetical protein
VVLFDRSWYNRAGVERVMGFATPEQVERFLKMTEISGNQWLICIAFAFALLLVDEVIKFFMRRRRQ